MDDVLIKYTNNYKYLEYVEYFRLLGIFVCIDNGNVNINNFSYYCDLNKNPILYLKDILNIDTTNIYNIFIKYKKIFLTYHYYCKDRKIFLDIAKEFNKIEEKSKYLKYAIIYCKYLSNNYNTKELVDDCLILLTKYPKFYNVWTLIGLIFSKEQIYTRNTLDAYQNVLNNLSNKPYASSIYFLYGKKCEQVLELTKIRDNAFIKANTCFKNYKNTYKIGRMYMEKENYIKAKEYFKESLELLNTHLEYLNPLEQEYYYVNYSHLSYISILQHNYEESILYAENALDYRDEIYEDKMIFYKNFYPNIIERKEVLTYIVHKLPSKQIYKYLGIAYQCLGLQKIANEYFNIVKILK